MQTSLCTYIVIVDMYSTRCTYPVKIQLILLNSLVRPGHIFSTIWPRSHEIRGTLIWLLLFIVDLSFCFFRKKTLSEESVFRFCTHSLTNIKLTMNVNWRKEWGILEWIQWYHKMDNESDFVITEPKYKNNTAIFSVVRGQTVEFLILQYQYFYIIECILNKRYSLLAEQL